MTALYRAYRPQKFDDVIGQESVVRTLRNAITSNKVAHAYLFCGSKGTGKTTMAKLLAKAMNCEQGPTIDPCGECETCVAIAEGRSIDVAEIDAASNTGVDNVREKIIETVAYRPARGARRVYILDEAHMLTTQAFNALLKTIEEPPDHVMFIFCTTETHKMMKTVRDRCQQLVFAPPVSDELMSVLRRTAEAEGIDADDDALRAISRVAQGSFRNALGTLDLIATAYERTFTAADVIRHLGTFDEEVLFAATDAVVAGDTTALLTIVEGLIQAGSDISQFASELGEHLRLVLLTRHGVDTHGAAVGNLERLRDQAERCSDEVVLGTIDCLSDAATRIRVGADARLSVETSLIRSSQGLGLPSLALRLARLEKKVTGSYGQPLESGAENATPQATQPAPVSAPAAPAPVSTASTSAASPVPVAAPATIAQITAVVSSQEVAATVSAEVTPFDRNDPAAWWSRIAAATSGEPSVTAALQHATPLQLTDTTLSLSTQMPVLFTDKLKRTLQDTVQSQLGMKVAIDIQSGGAPTPAAPPEATAVVAPEQPRGENEHSPANERDLRELESSEIDGADATAFDNAAEQEAGELIMQTFDATELPTR